MEKDVAEKEKIEIELLLEAIYRVYGYDFRHYAYDSIRRRINHGMRAMGSARVTALLDQVMHHPANMQELLRHLFINVTEMFRDPPLFRAFREKVVPFLHTYPRIRIWHAGCSTGEEVLSMAILLQEEGLYEKTRIYATDIDDRALDKARSGIYPLGSMKLFTSNYIQAGGTHSFSDYYTTRNDEVIFNPPLLRNVVFARHNLATDESFNEFNVILCRNVLIYFNKVLQNRVHRLFYDSLTTFGVLVLGSKESMRFMELESRYEMLDRDERLYRKLK